MQNVKKIVIGFLGFFIFVSSIYAETAMTESRGVSSADAILAKSRHDIDLGDVHSRANEPVATSDHMAPEYPNLASKHDEAVTQQVREVVQEAKNLVGTSPDSPQPAHNLTQEPSRVVSVMTPTVEPAEAITTQELIARLTALENSNRMLLEQVAQLTEKVNVLESGIKPGGSAGMSVSKESGVAFAKIQAHISGLKDYLGPQLFMVVAGFVIFVILLLLIKIIIPRRRGGEDVSYPQDDMVAKEQDFNLMEGQEGNAAKLNLARAYIEMGHDSKAQSMLYEVLAHGSDSEQEEAKSLLDKIKQK